ncbi:MerR family transcriptional regulator [Paenibacillus sp. OAS669]|uniref:MerR family transcriptional regulator n=1 Tax=Paenibacillus sp. OAS669 TaxID=2663821 RepID=UPI00178BD299|nr:MerR family transcriptional regulator [Paenibacillus sp. OAS669]MBE1442141.1 DNA-binding transcriptional MerR regulator [Paenibacillus sp. OAS669]
MNIKEVSEKSGLTKKAIRFYEQAGIIEVSKDPNNQYRVYNENQIETLKLVALLRSLDFTIEQIKRIVRQEEELGQELLKQESEMERHATDLKLKQQTIRALREELAKGTPVSILAEQFGQPDDMMVTLSRKIRTAFPGIFGQFVEVSLYPFLDDILIDTTESKNRVQQLVDLLDDIPPVPEDHYLCQWIASDDQISIGKLKESNASLYTGILRNDPAVLADVKANIMGQIEKIRQDSSFRKQISELMSKSKDLPNLTLGSPFSDMLETLSPRYAAVAKALRAIDEEVSHELGFDYKQYLQNLMEE